MTGKSMTPREALAVLAFATDEQSAVDALDVLEKEVTRVEKGVDVRAWKGDHGWHADPKPGGEPTVRGLLIIFSNADD